MVLRSWLSGALALALAYGAEPVLAAPPEVQKPAAAGKIPPPPLPAFTPQREAAALDFVAQHHPELSGVLAQLKGLKRDEYEQAIRELAQTQERLALAQQSDEALHDLMLDAWKADSQIKLLAARLACALEPDAAVEAELKTLLYKQVDLQRQIVEHNRQRTLAILEGLEDNIQWLKDHRDKLVDQRYRNLTRSQGKPRANKAAPAAASETNPKAK